MVILDRLKVSLVFVQNQNGVDLIFENVMNKLRENKIVFGIDEEVIKRFIKNFVFGIFVVVVQGKFFGKFVDGKFIYYFDIKCEIRLKEFFDGRVDYKDLGIVQNV